jgi:hypothetical protein
MLPDGRILQMRWEYTSRHVNLFHHLWTVSPDGTGAAVFCGNMNPNHVMIDAKPVPGGRPRHRGGGHGPSPAAWVAQDTGFHRRPTTPASVPSAQMFTRLESGRESLEPSEES